MNRQSAASIPLYYSCRGYNYYSSDYICCQQSVIVWIDRQTETRSGSVLTGLIPPAATNFQIFPKVGQSQGQGH